MKDNTLILFDCFGVIMGEIAPKLYAKHFPDPEEAKKYKNQVFELADMGDIEFPEVIRRTAAIFQQSEEETKKEWESFYWKNEELEKFIRSVKDKATIGLLSNAMKGLNVMLFKKFGILDLFDNMTISSNHHMTKPDPRIYQLCLDSYGKKFDRILFVDDNPVNLQNLSQFHMDTVLFSIPESQESIRKIREWLEQE